MQSHYKAVGQKIVRAKTSRAARQLWHIYFFASVVIGRLRHSPTFAHRRSATWSHQSHGSRTLSSHAVGPRYHRSHFNLVTPNLTCVQLPQRSSAAGKVSSRSRTTYTGVSFINCTPLKRSCHRSSGRNASDTTSSVDVGRPSPTTTSSSLHTARPRSRSNARSVSSTLSESSGTPCGLWTDRSLS